MGLESKVSGSANVGSSYEQLLDSWGSVGTCSLEGWVSDRRFYRQTTALDVEQFPNTFDLPVHLLLPCVHAGY